MINQPGTSPAVPLRLILGLLLAGCGRGGDPSPTATDIEILSGDGQNAQVGTAVAVDPSVRVTDAGGNPVSGVRVTFTVATGGGSLTGPSALTDANGVGTVGSWSLGPFAGPNTLNASVAGVGSVTFSAGATAGAPARLVALTVTSQVAVVGLPVSPSPAVKVVDAFDNGIPGISVTFTVTVGGGVITGSPVVTNATGVATLGSWTVDPVPGPNSLTASVALQGIAGNPLTFNATGVTSAYSIDLRFLSSVNGSQQQAFQNARQRLQALILGDLPDEAVTVPAGSCLSTQPAVNETIDDLIIFAQVVAIDGPGMVLGRAGPCVFHHLGAGLPIIGIMEFDVADLTTLQNNGTLDEVILHEMIHVVGLGSIWSQKGLLSGTSTTNPIFTGARAIVAFDSIGGAAYPGTPVPVENTGGAGTIYSHWRDVVFKSELMTGFINAGFNPLSVVTGSSLADLGYVVDLGATDPYTVMAPFVAPPIRSPDGVFLLDDIWQGPLFQLDSVGRPRPVPRW